MRNFFTDVISSDPAFARPARISDPGLLEPVLREKVRRMVDEAALRGIRLGVFETFRSQARQAELFRAGRTQLRAVGVHQYGLACDLVRIVDGRFNWEVDHAVVGQMAAEHRLVPGSDLHPAPSAAHPGPSRASSSTLTRGSSPGADGR